MLAPWGTLKKVLSPIPRDEVNWDWEGPRAEHFQSTPQDYIVSQCKVHTDQSQLPEALPFIDFEVKVNDGGRLGEIAVF